MNILITNQSEIPIYQQIKDQIKDAILSGELQDGELLPSIRKLANETHTSVLTTKRAYDELDAEGYVTSVPGKGSFVAAKNIEMLKEAKLKIVEAKLQEAFAAASSVGITIEDMHTMMDILYEDL